MSDRQSLIAAIEAEMESRQRGFADVRGELLFRCLDALNTPEVEDFVQGAVTEAQHQRGRWAVEDDAGKTPFDWFWLIGYLAQKAAASAVAGDVEKAKHHTISTAAVLANWHAFLGGDHTAMRPGIEPPQDWSRITPCCSCSWALNEQTGAHFCLGCGEPDPSPAQQGT